MTCILGNSREWLSVSVVLAALLGACPTGDDTDTGAGSGGQSCEMCGEDSCRPAGDCFDEAFCVLPAPEACVTCMMTNCPDSVGADCGGFDCVDYAKTIGGCGDAQPYAGEHYECMVAWCVAECEPGDGFTACSCI